MNNIQLFKAAVICQDSMRKEAVCKALPQLPFLYVYVLSSNHSQHSKINAEHYSYCMAETEVFSYHSDHTHLSSYRAVISCFNVHSFHAINFFPVQVL